MILDAKWKRLKPKNAAMGVSQADIYQMHGYARQYQCQQLALIYPSHRGIRAQQAEFITQEHRDRIEVWDVELSGVAGIGASVEQQLGERLHAMMA